MYKVGNWSCEMVSVVFISTQVDAVCMFVCGEA